MCTSAPKVRPPKPPPVQPPAAPPQAPEVKAGADLSGPTKRKKISRSDLGSSSSASSKPQAGLGS